MSSATEAPAERERGQFFTVEVDGTEFRFDHNPVTAIEIMDAASIPHSVGMVQILDDGTQETVKLDAVFDLRPGRQFKKRPKFKRG